MPEATARQYAEEIGAVFKLTSACTSTGIEELFKSIGCKFLDPNYREDDEGVVSASNTGVKNNGPVKLDAQKVKENKKKKGCW